MRKSFLWLLAAEIAVACSSASNGSNDAGTPASDASVADSSAPDSGRPQDATVASDTGGPMDASTPDTNEPVDASTPDTSTPDASTPDASDAGATDAATVPDAADAGAPATCHESFDGGLAADGGPQALRGTIVYTQADRDAGTDSLLYIAQLASAAPRLLGGVQGQDNTDPSFSLDGCRVVFATGSVFGHDTIATIQRDGAGLSTVTQCSAFCHEPFFGSDGRIWFRDSTTQSATIRSVEPAGGTPVAWPASPVFASNCTMPSFALSPDGTTAISVLATYDNSMPACANAGIYVAPLTAQTPPAPLKPTGGPEFFQAKLDASGDRVFFINGSLSGPGDGVLYSMKRDGSDVRAELQGFLYYQFLGISTLAVGGAYFVTPVAPGFDGIAAFPLGTDDAGVAPVPILTGSKGNVTWTP